jgi:hypothetical protein
VRTVLVLLLAGLSFSHAAETPFTTEPSAGQTELDALDGQIALMHQLLSDVEARKADLQQRGVELLSATAQLRIVTWTNYQRPAPTSVEDLGAWYVLAMKERDDFSVTDPMNDWNKSWIGLRRQEHRLHGEYEELRVSLRRLQALRDRLRRQLAK